LVEGKASATSRDRENPASAGLFVIDSQGADILIRGKPEEGLFLVRRYLSRIGVIVASRFTYAQTILRWKRAKFKIIT
ncbi:MAG: hypothetical protein COU46_02715, partial [Candidatus Niyogibacteria bacterium CG10_big_fil_rev_8_21_14_0_10_42_19]